MTMISLDLELSAGVTPAAERWTNCLDDSSVSPTAS
jgi:hypothetical protein